jgi:hypothetical protein
MIGLFSAALALAKPVYSHDPPLRVTGEWEKLYDNCRTATDETNPKNDRDRIRRAGAELACNSFILGAWGMHENLVALGKTDRQFCIPLNEPMKSVRKVVFTHMDTFQKANHGPDAAFAVLLALRFQYGGGCK